MKATNQQAVNGQTFNLIDRIASVLLLAYGAAVLAVVYYLFNCLCVVASLSAILIANRKPSLSFDTQLNVMMYGFPAVVLFFFVTYRIFKNNK